MQMEACSHTHTHTLRLWALRRYLKVFLRVRSSTSLSNKECHAVVLNSKRTDTRTCPCHREGCMARCLGASPGKEPPSSGRLVFTHRRQQLLCLLVGAEVLTHGFQHHVYVAGERGFQVPRVQRLRPVVLRQLLKGGVHPARGTRQLTKICRCPSAGKVP